jgi:sugar transferase (PEP-CTERM/EpsH1 system associated)
MKVLVLLSRIPWPLKKGDKLRAYHHIRILAQEHKVVLVCLTDAAPHPQAVEHLSPYCEEIHFIKLSKLGILWNLATSIFNDKPFQVNYFYQKRAQRRVDKIIEKHMPRHLFVQLVRTAEYVKKYHVITSTFDYMDAFSVGAQRRVEKAFPGIRTLLSMEAKRLKKYENFVFNRFTHKTIISKTDRDLIEHPEKNQIVILPNGVDFETFQPQPKTPKKFDLVFTGNMSYPPNIKAAQYLVEDILPLVKVPYPQISMAIAGAEPHSSVKKLASKNVVITGWVENITHIYSQSRIFIAPMHIGTGMQNKLLEAMAMNIPCITSSLAANAIGGTHLENMLIANSPQEYVEGIQLLMENPEIYTRIVTNAHQFVDNRYNWSKNGEILLKLISKE